MSGKRGSRADLVEAARLGYVHEGRSGSGHLRFRHQETGRVVFLPHTPGQGRSTSNSIALLRRVARQA